MCNDNDDDDVDDDVICIWPRRCNLPKSVDFTFFSTQPPQDSCNKVDFMHSFLFSLAHLRSSQFFQNNHIFNVYFRWEEIAIFSISSFFPNTFTVSYLCCFSFEMNSKGEKKNTKSNFLYQATHKTCFWNIFRWIHYWVLSKMYGRIPKRAIGFSV